MNEPAMNAGFWRILSELCIDVLRNLDSSSTSQLEECLAELEYHLYIFGITDGEVNKTGICLDNMIGLVTHAIIKRQAPFFAAGELTEPLNTPLV